MMFRTVSLLSLVISSGMATPVGAAPLQPSDNWHIDYGDTQCTAARSFTTASGPVVVGIVPSVSGDSYRLLISIERPGPAFAQQSRGSVNFGSGPIAAQSLYFGGKGIKLSVYQYRLTAAEMDQARLATQVGMHADDGARFTFALSDMPAVLDGLGKCTSDLQRYWNMGGAGKVVSANMPVRDIRSIFTPSDYPSEALRRLQQGTAQFQLLVDEKGAVAGCDVLAPSGVASLDATGCEVIKERARFTPARDAHGTPVRSVYTTPPVTWRLADLSDLDTGCMKMMTSYPALVSICDRQMQRVSSRISAPPIVVVNKPSVHKSGN